MWPARPPVSLPTTPRAYGEEPAVLSRAGDSPRPRTACAACVWRPEHHAGAVRRHIPAWLGHAPCGHQAGVPPQTDLGAGRLLYPLARFFPRSTAFLISLSSMPVRVSRGRRRCSTCCATCRAPRRMPRLSKTSSMPGIRLPTIPSKRSIRPLSPRSTVWSGGGLPRLNLDHHTRIHHAEPFRPAGQEIAQGLGAQTGEVSPPRH
jgi:hypothetical protein